MPWHQLANTEGRMGSRTLRGRIFLRYLFERNIYWSKTGVKKTPTLLTEYVVHSDILGFLFCFRDTHQGVFKGSSLDGFGGSFFVVSCGNLIAEMKT